MGLGITTRPTQTMPLLRSLTRRSGVVAAIDMSLLAELARLWVHKCMNGAEGTAALRNLAEVVRLMGWRGMPGPAE